VAGGGIEMASVQTVTGPVDANTLGVTLIHEHLLIDARWYWRNPQEASRIHLAHQPVSAEILHELRQDPFVNLDNCGLFDEEVASEEVMQFKLLGGRTVVDATSANIGRDPLALRRIAERTGLQIVMGAGYYLERTHPDWIRSATVEDLAARIIADVLEGAEGTEIRAGHIGEIGISKDFTSQEEKVLRAAARAQRQTQVALSVHLPGWERLAHRVLDVVAEEGGDLNRVVLNHMNPSGTDLEYQMALADRGAYLSYDMIGMDYYYADQDAQSPSDEENARAIVGLVRAGYGHKVVLSQDVFIKMMLTRYGGNGYAYILRHFVPRLKRHGLSRKEIDQLLIENPRRVLAGT